MRNAQLYAGPVKVTDRRRPLPMFNGDKVILSLYDYSGEWSKPYREAGYRVIQVDRDLDGTDIRLYNPPAEIQQVYGILAAPPCTVFSKAGLWVQRSQDEYLEALGCVTAVLRLVHKYKPVFWSLENPQGKLKDWLGEPSLKFQPFHYGDPHTKYTYLWGQFNEPPRNQVQPIRDGKGVTTTQQHGMRGRSNTPAGFARQFFLANQ